MLKKDFEELRDLIRNAQCGDRWRLVSAAFQLQQSLSQRIQPNINTESVMFGMLDTVISFADTLRHAKDLPRFTLLRKRFWLLCAVGALEDELKCQLRQDSACA